MVMPLKLAGILMKYMQLQRAQMSSCQSWTDKTAGVFCSSGCFKEDPSVLQPPPSFCKFWDTLKGGEHPTEKLGKTTQFSLLCEKLAGAERARARREQVGICPCRQRAGFL